VGRELATAAKIDIPETGLRGSAFQPKFAGVAPFTDPHHAELALVFSQLHFQQFAESNLPAKSQYERPRAANAGSPGILHERQGVCVQSPNTDWKNCLNSWAPSAVHAAILEISGKE
jgi:hypothetical protein